MPELDLVVHGPDGAEAGVDGFRLNTLGVSFGLDGEAVEIGLKRLGPLGQIGEGPLKMRQVHPVILQSLGAESAPAEHKFGNGLFS